MYYNLNGLISYNEIYLRRYQLRFVIEPDPVLRIWKEIQQESDKQLSPKRKKYIWRRGKQRSRKGCWSWLWPGYQRNQNAADKNNTHK